MKLKRRITALAALSVAAALAFHGPSLAAAASKNIATGSTGYGDALVELSPLGVEDGKLVVEVAVDTHSVNLGDVDLSEAAVLRYGGGEARPLSAPRLRGHHGYGKLVFGVDPGPSAFSIVIKGIPKVMERVYEWEEGL